MEARPFDAEAVVEACRRLNVDSLTTGEVHELVLAMAQVSDALEAARARVLARWDADRTWANNGSRSAAARLRHETKCAPTTASRLLRRARGLRHAPTTAQAFDAGRITADRADLLVRLNTSKRRERFTEAEADLVDMAARLDHHDLELAFAYWRNHADSEAPQPDPNDEPEPQSELFLGELLDGVLDVRGSLQALDAEVVQLEIERLADQLRADDRRHGRERTPAQLRAAALVEMASRSASTPPGAKRPAPLITVLMGHSSFEHMCQTASGRVITPKQVVPHLDAAMLETILFDGPHTVITVSHKRTFTGALRRAIQVRDRRCRHPAGCDVPLHRTDVDHIVPHRKGGPTAQWNGRLECPPHNRIPDLHDDGATPYPQRDVTPLEAARLRARYMYLRDEPLDDP